MVNTKDKRGLTSLMLIFFAFIVFFIILFLGVQAFAVTQVQDVFSILDFEIGNQSFNQTYNNTLDPALGAIVDSSDNAGVLLIFGMVIVMLLIGYNFSTNRLWILLDLLVIVVSFVIAVILSRSFETFINMSPEFLNLYSTTMQKSSTLILNLPFIVIVTGSLIMIVTYGILKKKEQFNQFG